MWDWRDKVIKFVALLEKLEILWKDCSPLTDEDETYVRETLDNEIK